MNAMTIQCLIAMVLWFGALWFATYITTIPVYRMYNPVNGEHLYTTDAHEVNVIYKTQGWGFEGIGWYTPSSGGDPIYRLYNPKLGNHHYTSDLHEIDVITKTQGWVLDFDGAPIMNSGGVYFHV